jgi:hypothetical protein
LMQGHLRGCRPQHRLRRAGGDASVMQGSAPAVQGSPSNRQDRVGHADPPPLPAHRPVQGLDPTCRPDC